MPYCENDGNEMFEVLNDLGYEIADNKKLIGHVSGVGMREAITTFFKTAKYKDTLLLYYSGHGIPEIKGDVYLASSDIDQYFPEIGGISFDSITRMMQQSTSKNKVVFLDCCYSGAAKLAKGSANDAAKLGSEAISNKGSQLLHTGEGTCILSASQAYQEAVMLEEKNHSLFTYYLLEGLLGNKDALDSHGYITADSLSNFIFDKIMSLPPEKRFNQKPVKILEASGNIILVSPTDLAQVGICDTESQTTPGQNSKSNIVSEPLPKAARRHLQQIKNPKILLPVVAALAIGVVLGSYYLIGISVPVNHPPTALNQTVTTSINKPIVITLKGKDQDYPNKLTSAIISKPSHGSLGPISRNAFVYMPSTNFVGVDRFTFKVNDGKNNSYNTGIVSIAVNDNTFSPNSFIQYENSTFGIKIRYPAHWYTSMSDASNNKSEGNIRIVSFFPRSTNDSAAVNISVDSLNATKSVAEYLSDTIATYRSNIEHFKTVDVDTNSTLSGLPAYRLLYTSAHDYCCAPKSTHFEVLEIGTIIDGRIYYIQYTNDPTLFNKDLPTVEKMISSFEIAKQTNLLNRTFTYHDGYLAGISDAYRGADEGYGSDVPYAQGYRDGHRDGLKNRPGFHYYYNTSFSRPTVSFIDSFEELVNNIHNLTHSYENEYLKWQTHKYDNKTMVSITDNYSPKYLKFVTMLKGLQPPKQLQNATDLYIKSLESQLQGNIHFRNYLLTNSYTDVNLSSEFLSNASDYKIEAFKKLRSAGLFSTVP